MEAHPARTLGWNTRKRERVRCSSLIDWPVYPRLGTLCRDQSGRAIRADAALPQWPKAAGAGVEAEVTRALRLGRFDHWPSDDGPAIEARPRASSSRLARAGDNGT